VFILHYSKGSSINEILALEKRPEMEDLPSTEGGKGKNGEPGEILLVYSSPLQGG